jgi:arylsulfatase A-like enzyme
MTNPASAQPNILFIVADDLGFGDISCYGNPILETPNLDRLAEGGLRLEQHYVESPICAPSRASMLTGKYHHRVGAVDVPSNRGLDRIHLNTRTIGNEMSDLGYRTHMIGKWHTGLHDLAYHPNARGFHDFFGFLNGGMDYYDWVLDQNGRTIESDGRYLTDVFTEAAIDVVTADDERPFFLHLAYNTPHTPLQAPEALIEKYRASGELTEAVAILYAMIESMDAGIGRVVDALEASGELANTLIVFTSDNGPYLFEDFDRYNGGLAGAKTFVLEGGIRVPAIVHMPGTVEADWQSDSLVHALDWFPTFVTAAGGIPDMDTLDGFSAWDFLQGKAEHATRTHYWQFNRYRPLEHCNAAIRSGDWKLVWDYREGSIFKDETDQAYYVEGLKSPPLYMEIDPELPEPDVAEPTPPKLFNLREDYGETTDLAAQHPDRVTEMTSQWDAWWAEMMRDYEKARAENVK